MTVDPVTREVLDDAGADVEVALPVRRHDAASGKAPLVGPDKVRTLKVPAALARLAEAIVDRGPLVPYLEAAPRPGQPAHRGKVRALSVRSRLVALSLLALTEQAMIVRDAVALVNGLHLSTKNRLGVPRVVTERLFSRLFNQLAHEPC